MQPGGDGLDIRMHAFSFRVGLAVLGLLVAAPAWAAGLVIGRASEQFSVDPQFADSGNNISTAADMFDNLLATDAANQVHPALAIAWQATDPLTWRISLRPGVTFHDGSQLTAADVVFSLERLNSLVRSPAPYSALRGVTALEAVDPLTVVVKTVTPTPQLMEQLGDVAILSEAAAQSPAHDLVGAGPYRLAGAAPGELHMAANPGYWGGKPGWDRVTLKFIPGAAARVAALLSGDVDLIDQLAPADARQIGNNTKFSVFSNASSRLVYLALDSGRPQSPYLTDSSGGKLAGNPLADPRVRLAISKSIDRAALASRLLDGSAEPAGQVVPAGMGGYDPGLLPEKLDLTAAKQLLSDAGYPHGFGLTLHASSDRLPMDSAVAQALGQMLRRAGFAVNGVVPLPYSSFAPAASRGDFSVFLFSIGTPASNASGTLTAVLASYDPAHGMGAFNRVRYSNAAFDAVLRQALSAFDEASRNALLAQATRIAIADTALVPLYWQVVHWAARGGIDYVARRDEITAARYAIVR